MGQVTDEGAVACPRSLTRYSIPPDVGRRSIDLEVALDAPVPVVAIATWLVPGSGYLLLGQLARGLTIGLTVIVLFVMGILIGGIHVVDPPIFVKGATRWRRCFRSRRISGSF